MNARWSDTNDRNNTWEWKMLMLEDALDGAAIPGGPSLRIATKSAVAGAMMDVNGEIGAAVGDAAKAGWRRVV